MKDFEGLVQYFQDKYELEDFFMQYVVSLSVNHGESEYMDKVLKISQDLLTSEAEMSKLKNEKQAVKLKHSSLNRQQNFDFEEMSQLRNNFSVIISKYKEAEAQYNRSYNAGVSLISEISKSAEDKPDNKPKKFNPNLTVPKIDRMTGYVKDVNKIKADCAEHIIKYSDADKLPKVQRAAEKKVYIDAITEVLRVRGYENDDAHTLDEMNVGELIRIYNNFLKDKTLFNRLVEWLVDNRILSQKESLFIERKFYEQHNRNIFKNTNYGFNKSGNSFTGVY